MAAEKAPAYQWYPKDYESDEAVKLMTYEQEGIYRRLLDHQALHGGIPSDVRQIAMLCPKVPAKRFLALWPGMVSKFILVDGKLVNQKLERVKAGTAKFIADKQRGGRASAEQRAEQTGSSQPSRPSTGKATAPEPASATASASATSSAFATESRRRSAGQPPLNLGLRRLKVWRWMLDDLIAALGDHADAFDLESWLQELDASQKGVMPETWPWLKTELIAEARRRGLPMAESSERKPLFTKSAEEMGAAVLANLNRTTGLPR